MYRGKTVEVLNTDAEGRLVLADALARACEDSPDLLVDVATLTGAHRWSRWAAARAAIMTNDDDVRAHVHDAGRRRPASRCGRCRCPRSCASRLESSVADIANIGERFGGRSRPGIFLKEFVAEGIKWAHLDIAGPAFNEGEPHGYTPKGGTGVAVRTLVTIAEDVAAN